MISIEAFSSFKVRKPVIVEIVYEINLFFLCYWFSRILLSANILYQIWIGFSTVASNWCRQAANEILLPNLASNGKTPPKIIKKEIWFQYSYQMAIYRIKSASQYQGKRYQISCQQNHIISVFYSKFIPYEQSKVKIIGFLYFPALDHQLIGNGDKDIVIGRIKIDFSVFFSLKLCLSSPCKYLMQAISEDYSGIIKIKTMWVVIHYSNSTLFAQRWPLRPLYYFFKRQHNQVNILKHAHFDAFYIMNVFNHVYLKH